MTMNETGGYFIVKYPPFLQKTEYPNTGGNV